MKIYIAGKITGDKHYKKKFRKAEKKLAKLGHSVMNPANLGNYSGFSWEDYMKTSRAMQDVCEAVLFLPDWKNSRGAFEEWEHAGELGQKKFFDIKEVNDRNMKFGRHNV